MSSSGREPEAIWELAQRLGLAPTESAPNTSSLSDSLRETLAAELARGSTLSGEPAPSAPVPLTTGDRFVVMASLGGGGMGDVFRAFDRKLERFTALKLLRGNDRGTAERLRREARAQAQVEHANVCRIFDVFDDPAPGFIVMELIDGVTLDRVPTTLPFDDKLALAIQVADAVAAAHARMVLHRDLKPQNVLVTRDWRRAIVTDFGLARPLDEAGQGGIAGTPGFMAPEQARGEALLTAATDVYGLGATLYALFHGAPPYGGSRAEVMASVLRGPPPPLYRLPRDLGAVIARCMATDPLARYQTAVEVAAELGRVLVGDATEARPHGLFERGLRGARRRWPIAVGLALLAGLLGLTAVQRRTAEARLTASAQLAAIATREEARLREATFLPPHDVSAERRQIVASLAPLDAIRSDDTSLAGARAAARGRILLAAGRTSDAAVALDAAYADGDRSPALLVARARVALDEYEREVGTLARLAPAARDERLQLLDTKWRRPALAALAPVAIETIAGGAALREALSHAPTASWNDVFAADEAKCKQSIGDAEPCRLAGDAATREARRASFTMRHDDARAWLSRAAEAYQRGLHIARSDPSLHRRACVTAAAHVAQVATERGNVVEPVTVEAALGVCAAAAAVVVDDPAIQLAQTELAVQRSSEGSTAERRAAALLAERLLANQPNDVERLVLAAWAEERVADSRLVEVDGAPPEYTLAMIHLRRANLLMPGRADVLGDLAQILNRSGLPNQTPAALAEAAELCKASHRILPDNRSYVSCYQETAVNEARLAYQHGKPYRQLFEAIFGELERLIARYPTDPYLPRALDSARQDLIDQLGMDRRPELALIDTTIASVERYVARYPSYAYGPRHLRGLRIDRAIAAAMLDLADPRAEMQRLIASEALHPERDPIDAERMSQIYWVVFEWCAGTGEPCRDWRERARRDADRFERPVGVRQSVPSAVAGTALSLADLAIDEGHDPTPLLRQCERTLAGSGQEEVLRPSWELSTLRWQAMTAETRARALDGMRAWLVKTQATRLEGYGAAVTAEMIAVAACALAKQSRDAADRSAARDAVAEYARLAPTDRLHMRRLQRLLADAIAPPAQPFATRR